jgi:hypothetical protein
MHPLFAQFLQRRAARHESIPGHVLRTSLGPSREMSIRRPGAASRPGSGMVLFMSQPPRPLQAPAVPDALDIVLDELHALSPIATADTAPPAQTTRGAEPEGVHLRIDPQDHQRVRISGSMREVCAALDALIAVQ